MKTQTIGIIAIKGGVGKTTTTFNIGAVLARQFNKKVLMIDANFSAPNLGLHMGLVDPEKTLHHVLLKRADFHEALYEYEKNLHIIPGALIGKRVSLHLLAEKLKRIKKNYDVVLLDSSPALNDEMLATIIASDKLFVVTSPDYPTLSATMRAVKIARQKKTPITGLILNKVRKKKFELSIHDIEEASGVPVLAVLPDDVKVLHALSETKHMIEHAPKKSITHEYKQLGACIVGEDYKDPRLRAKFKKLLSRTPHKTEVNRLQLREEKK